MGRCIHGSKPRRCVCCGPEWKALQKCRRYKQDLENLVLGKCVDAIEKIFGISTARPCLKGLNCTQSNRKVKEWTTGIDVLISTGRLGRRERAGCRFSFFLLKKSFPDPCDCLSLGLEDWFRERTRPHTGELPEGFLDFVTEEIRRIYPPGWDSSYVDAIGRYAPNSSSCTERSLAKGGSRAESNLDEYLSAVIGERDCSLSPYVLKSINTSGKQRLLTVTPKDLAVLKPLHKLMFGRIRKQRWSLIGPPRTLSFEKAGFKFEHPILSGDYKGATDNLDLRVSQAILEAVLVTATTIPASVKQLARMSLLPDIQLGDKILTNRRGQMMGAFLSFPLLCLYNRVCSAFSLGRHTPMLINGDDLVAETPDPSPWFDILPRVGLEPEKSKTSYERGKAEINSTLFLFKGMAFPVPIIRTRALLRRDYTAVVGGDLDSFCKESYELKSRAEGYYLQRLRSVVLKGLNLGLHLSDLGFNSTHVPLLRSSGIFGSAVRLARRLHRRVPLPSGVKPLNDTRVVYGTLSFAQASWSHYENTGNLFGSVSFFDKTSRYVKEWWETLRSEELTIPKAVKLQTRFELYWIACKPVTMFYGEPMPVSKFKQRLLSSLESVKPESRVAASVLHLIPPSVRWNITIKTAAEG
nr:MAG: putative RNA-dependent RNA polymerase [Plasmopara viticola lesion associated ourmia-like virus 50]